MSYKRQQDIKKSEELRNVHPVWRGIGFIMMVLIPLVAFAASDILIQALPDLVAGFALPEVLMFHVTIPGYGEVRNMGAVIVMTLLLSATFYSLFLLINSVIINVMGGDPADKLHVPTERYKAKRKFKK
jgi:hypothetical protein